MNGLKLRYLLEDLADGFMSVVALDHGYRTALYVLTGLLLAGVLIAATLVRRRAAWARARQQYPG